ncbi:MAG: peptidoglycan-binding protein [Myxococcota bacterium]
MTRVQSPPPRVQSTNTSTTQAPATSSFQPGPGLQEVRNGGVLMQGHGGASVSDIQARLNAAGAQPPLEVDGKFGPRTEAAVRRFQAANGLDVDGKVGPQTLAALERGGSVEGAAQGRARQEARQATGNNQQTRAPTTQEQGTRPEGTQRAGDLQQADAARRVRGASAGGTQAPGRSDAPFAGDRAAREQQAEQLLRSNGQWPPREGHVYAIQIDQDSPPAGASAQDKSNHLRSYTGQTAVFQARNGRLVEIEGPMRSASHPGQKSTSGFTDVNGDGRSDIAHLRAGTYEYRASSHNGRFNPVSDRNISVARDTNQDGVIDARENAASQQRGDYATALQWHAGNSTRPSSVGCQTMPPDDFARFQRAVRTGDDNSFTYLLVRRPNDQHGANPL